MGSASLAHESLKLFGSSLAKDGVGVIDGGAAAPGPFVAEDAAAATFE